MLLRIATTTLTVLLLAALTLLSVRGMIDPQGAAANFGVPATDPEAAFYQIVYRSRNLMIAIAGFIFLFAGMWRALAILTTVAIGLPLFDIAALKLAATPVSAVHPATLVALVVVAALLWMRVRATSP
jgi:Domain of unknown function (DUF4267)